VALGSGRMRVLFTLRRRGRSGRRSEVAHFYGPTGGKIFEAYTERALLRGLLSLVNGHSNYVRLTRGGIILEGARGEDLFHKLIIMAGVRQCVQQQDQLPALADAIAKLGAFETLFWYSKIVEAYERMGYWGVCRVARAFRILHGEPF